MKELVDVTPDIKIYGSYRSLDYDIPSVVCEFVDNSISSYELNLKELKEYFGPKYVLKIYVIYDKDKDRLIIQDNAFGMTYEDLKSAVKLQSKPKSTVSLNQHGMGMKTASVWLGDELRVETSQLGVNYKAESLHKINDFISGADNKVVVNNNTSEEVHNSYTKITISKLCRMLKNSHFTKLIRTIKLTYNRRLENDNIQISVCFKEKGVFNDFINPIKKGKKVIYPQFYKLDELDWVKFEKQKIAFYEKTNRWCNWSWKDEIESETFGVSEKLKFEGFIAITEDAKPFPGIYFSKNGRVVELYKSKILSGVTANRKIFGYLDFKSGIKTNQTKNKVIWTADLQDLFDERLNNFIKENEIDTIAFNFREKAKTIEELNTEFVKLLKKRLKNKIYDLDIETTEDKQKILLQVKEPPIHFEIEIKRNAEPEDALRIKYLSKKRWLMRVYIEHNSFKDIGIGSQKKLLSLINIFVGFVIAVYKELHDRPEILISTINKFNYHLIATSLEQIKPKKESKIVPEGKNSEITENNKEEDKKPEKEDKDESDNDIKIEDDESGFIFPQNWFKGYEIDTAEDAKNKAKAKENEKEINTFLTENKITAQINNYQVGPQYTSYLVKLKSDNLQRFLNLVGQLKFTLGSEEISIEQPVDASTLAINVPNPYLTNVDIVPVLQKLKDCENTIRLPLGGDINNNIQWIKLEELPHLLVAGATGSGKTYFLKTIITLLISQKIPQELQLLIIDEKTVDTSIFANVPHLWKPIINKLSEIETALQEVVELIEERKIVLNRNECSDILELNRTVSKEKRMPFLIIIIDEVAKVLASKKRVSSLLSDLAARARFVGIYIILVMQRPEAKIIDGSIKTNFLGRLSFKLPSSRDSQVILDEVGAELLRGRGDLFYKDIKTGKLKRAQAPFISKDVIKKAIKFIRKKSE